MPRQTHQLPHTATELLAIIDRELNCRLVFFHTTHTPYEHGRHLRLLTVFFASARACWSPQRRTNYPSAATRAFCRTHLRYTNVISQLPKALCARRKLANNYLRAQAAGPRLDIEMMSRPSTASLSRPVTASFSRPYTPSLEGRHGAGMPMLPGCSQPDVRTNFAKPHIFDITHDGLATESANKVAVARTLRGDFSALPEQNLRGETPAASQSSTFNSKRPFTPTFVANSGKVRCTCQNLNLTAQNVTIRYRYLYLSDFITNLEPHRVSKSAKFLCIFSSKMDQCACARMVEIWWRWVS